MTTDINVISTAYQVEKRSWYLGSADIPGFVQSITLDVSAFNAAHYVNGYIPSGTILAVLDTGGKAVPYLDAGTGGQGVAKGILFSAVKIPNLADLTKDVGGAMLVAFAPVSVSKLPFTSSTTSGGFIDTNGRAELPHIYWAA
jgi:hypothetical protein